MIFPYLWILVDDGTGGLLSQTEEKWAPSNSSMTACLLQPSELMAVPWGEREFHLPSPCEFSRFPPPSLQVKMDNMMLCSWFLFSPHLLRSSTSAQTSIPRRIRSGVICGADIDPLLFSCSLLVSLPSGQQTFGNVKKAVCWAFHILQSSAHLSAPLIHRLRLSIW